MLGCGYTFETECDKMNAFAFSKENDMIALKWYHPAVIDTAVLFGGGMGSKRSLRSLADSHLGRKIQTGSEGQCK